MVLQAVANPPTPDFVPARRAVRYSPAPFFVYLSYLAESCHIIPHMALITVWLYRNRLCDNVTSANSLSAFQQQLKHTLFQQSFPDMWHFLTVTPIVVLAVASLLRLLWKLIGWLIDCSSNFVIKGVYTYTSIHWPLVSKFIWDNCRGIEPDSHAVRLLVRYRSLLQSIGQVLALCSTMTVSVHIV